jgi:hypothetical protein
MIYTYHAHFVQMFSAHQLTGATAPNPLALKPSDMGKYIISGKINI